MRYQIKRPTSWSEVLRILRQKRRTGVRNAELAVPKWTVDHPIGSGAVPHQGLPRGERAHWRFTATNCTGLHALEFEDRYLVHLDRADPRCDFPGHVAKDVLPAMLGPLAVAAAVLLLGIFVSPR